MNRRSFLKGLLGTATAAALPVGAQWRRICSPSGGANIVAPVHPDNLGDALLWGEGHPGQILPLQREYNAQTRALLDSFREVTEIVARRAARSLNERWEKPGDNPLGFPTSPDGGRASGEAA